MRAIILAGGKGTRLRPLTLNFPKPLVPVGDAPILEVVIRQLAAAGFTRVTISTGYLAELIEAYFSDGAKWGIAIDYVREDAPLSTAGPLKLVGDLPEHFLVMNGDVLTDVDYAGLVREHIESGAAATVATTTREAKIDFGVVEADDEGWLDRWTEKPVYSFDVSMGVYVVSRASVDLIADGEALGMPDLLLRAVDNGGRVLCRKCDCYWLDIGRVDDYETAQKDFAANRDRLVPSDG
jgi:NDP-sugar pyrophosphorylase family protein